jgi:hypothetical protein
MWGDHARYVFGYRGTGVERGHARRTEPLAAALLPGARRKNAATAPPQAAALTGALLLRASCRAQWRQGQQRSADRGSGGFIRGVSRLGNRFRVEACQSSLEVCACA